MIRKIFMTGILSLFLIGCIPETKKQEKLKISEVEELYCINSSCEENENRENSFCYEVIDNQIAITKYIGNEENVKIPSEIDGKKVIKLSKDAFSGNNYIKEVSLPEGLLILESAFYRCHELKEIYIPKTVEKISDGNIFFACTSLEKIIVSEENINYESIEGILFDKKNKSLMTYPEGRKTSKYIIPTGTLGIDNDAFGYRASDLMEITIPKSVVNFPDYNILGDSGHLITVNVYVNSVAEEYVKKYSKVEEFIIEGKNIEEGMKYTIIN